MTTVWHDYPAWKDMKNGGPIVVFTGKIFEAGYIHFTAEGPRLRIDKKYYDVQAWPIGFKWATHPREELSERAIERVIALQALDPEPPLTRDRIEHHFGEYEAFSGDYGSWDYAVRKDGHVHIINDEETVTLELGHDSRVAEVDLQEVPEGEELENLKTILSALNIKVTLTGVLGSLPWC